MQAFPSHFPSLSERAPGAAIAVEWIWTRQVLQAVATTSPESSFTIENHCTRRVSNPFHVSSLCKTNCFMKASAFDGNPHTLRRKPAEGTCGMDIDTSSGVPGLSFSNWLIGQHVQKLLHCEIICGPPSMLRPLTCFYELGQSQLVRNFRCTIWKVLHEHFPPKEEFQSVDTRHSYNSITKKRSRVKDHRLRDISTVPNSLRAQMLMYIWKLGEVDLWPARCRA